MSFRQLDEEIRDSVSKDMLSFFHGKIGFEELMSLKFPHLFKRRHQGRLYATRI